MANSGEWLESAPSFLKFLFISKTFSMPPTTHLFKNSSGAILK